MDEMIRISSTEAGHYLDAVLAQPVVVTRDGRDRSVMISTEEYHRLKHGDRRVESIEDFTDEDIALIAKSEAPPGYEHPLGAELRRTRIAGERLLRLAI